MPYEKVSTLATPFFSLRLGIPVVLRIKEPFKLGQARTEKGGEPKPMEPGFVALCEILEVDGKDVGVALNIVGFPAIAKRSIEEAHPKSSYVGRTFEITREAKTGAGKANPMRVHEVRATK